MSNETRIALAIASMVISLMSVLMLVRANIEAKESHERQMKNLDALIDTLEEMHRELDRQEAAMKTTYGR